MILRILGRIFIAAGVIILLFLAYQLWGTSFVAERNQRALAADADFLETPEAPITTPRTYNPGDPVGRIEIPKIDVDWIVVEGVTVEILKKGPGHFPGTPMPGQGGNVVISGHRATYGAPFAEMDGVEPGDSVKMTTADGVFNYRIVEKKIVQPTELSVVASTDEERLTLTTCHPQYSSKLRMIVLAEPVEDPKPA